MSVKKFWQSWFVGPVVEDESMTQKQLESVPEADRAGVLKAHIAEVQATRRKRIEDAGLTDRSRDNSAGYQNTRIGYVVALVMAIICAAIVGGMAVSAWNDVQIKALQGPPPPPPPAAPTPPAYNIQVTPAPAASH